MMQDNNISGENAANTKAQANAAPSEQEAPCAPQEHEAPPARPRHVRRVGTFTMGVALIITGLALTASLLMPSLDIMLIVKLAPLVLVALGLEIFISACFTKAEKIKYDGLSVFMCLLLIFASFTASLIPTVLMYAGPQRNAATANIEREIEDILYQNRKELNDIYDVQISVNLNELRKFTGEETMADLTATDYVYAYFVLNGDYKSEEEFVRAAKPACDILLNQVPNIRKIEVNMREDYASEEKYSLVLRGRFHEGLSEQELIKLVSVRYYNSEQGCYLTEDEYRQWQSEKKRLADESTSEALQGDVEITDASGV